MSETRRYSIEIKDVSTQRPVLFTAADWDDDDLRVAVAQVMRLVGPPDDNCFVDEVAPGPQRRKGEP
jgi:hypothetical protein